MKSITYHYVRAFLRFVEFYKKIIKKFNKIAKSLTNLFKKRKKEEFDQVFKLTNKPEITFEQLEKVSTKTSILLHFDFKRKI